MIPSATPNHRSQMGRGAEDQAVVLFRQTLSFQVLFVFVVLAHERRRVVHFNVTDSPTAKWTSLQILVPLRLCLKGTLEIYDCTAPGYRWLEPKEVIEQCAHDSTTEGADHGDPAVRPIGESLSRYRQQTVSESGAEIPGRINGKARWAAQ